jgi:hypothetical protein
MLSFLNEARTERKPVFSTKPLQFQGSKIQAPVIYGTCLQRQKKISVPCGSGVDRLQCAMFMSYNIISICLQMCSHLFLFECQYLLVLYTRCLKEGNMFWVSDIKKLAKVFVSFTLSKE